MSQYDGIVFAIREIVIMIYYFIAGTLNSIAFSSEIPLSLENIIISPGFGNIQWFSVSLYDILIIFLTCLVVYWLIKLTIMFFASILRVIFSVFGM